MKKITLLVSLSFVSLVVLSGWVRAEQQSNVSTQQQSSQSDDEQCVAAKKTGESRCLTERLQARINQRCSVLQEKTNQIANRVQNLQQSRTNLLDNVSRVLNNFVNRLQTNNIDATELKNNLSHLDALISETKTAWDDYQTKLQALATSKCDEEAQNFHQSLEESKSALNQVKTKMAAVRDFIKSDIKIDLAMIRDQLINQNNNQ